MKNKSGKVVVFIASLIVGLLIALNFNFDGMASTQLTAKEYQDAIEERNRLYKEISMLDKTNNEVAEKIVKYKYDDEKNVKVLEDMRDQVSDYGMLTGLNEVKGPGLLITIRDAIIDFDEDTPSEQMSKILHDSDIALIINEIRAAGAEAIAINNHRVTPSTGVSCMNAFIGFEDRDMEGEPFQFYVIGNSDSLEESLNAEGSHLRELKLYRKLNITVEKKNEIIMPAANHKEIQHAVEDLKKK